MEEEKDVKKIVIHYEDGTEKVMVEKQDEAIHQLSELVKKQAFEIAHMKNICGFADEKALEQMEGTKLVQEVLVKYGKL